MVVVELMSSFRQQLEPPSMAVQ